MRAYTLKHYQILHRAWARNPPTNWLKAAELGYKSPSEQTERLANTRRMFEMLSGRNVIKK